MKPEKFKKYPISKATAAPEDGPHMVMLNRWWEVEDECLLFFAPTNSPQCNSDKRIVEKFKGVADVIFIERVYIPLTGNGDYDV